MNKYSFAIPCTAALALLGGCAPQPEQGPEGGQDMARRVTVIEAQATDLHAYIDALGEAAATQEVAIVPQASGRLVAIHAEEGAEVREGDLLYTIEQAPYEAALKQASGQVQALEAQLRLARLEVERSRPLLADQLISSQEFDSYELRVAQLQGQLEAALGVQQQASVNLGYTEIHAPVAGRMGFYEVTAGNVLMAGQSQPLTTLRATSPIYIDFSVPADDFARLRAHQQEQGSLRVRVAALGDHSGQSREGQLKILGNQVNRATGTVELRAVLENKDNFFWPGQSVNVRIFLEALPQTITVPQGVVQLSQQGHFVMVTTMAEQGYPTVEQRPVSVGQLQDNGHIAILGGVEPGERLIESGQIFLFPGMPIDIANGETGNPE